MPLLTIHLTVHTLLYISSCPCYCYIFSYTRILYVALLSCSEVWRSLRAMGGGGGEQWAVALPTQPWVRLKLHIYIPTYVHIMYVQNRQKSTSYNLRFPLVGVRALGLAQLNGPANPGEWALESDNRLWWWWPAACAAARAFSSFVFHVNSMSKVSRVDKATCQMSCVRGQTVKSHSSSRMSRSVSTVMVTSWYDTWKVTSWTGKTNVQLQPILWSLKMFLSTARSRRNTEASSQLY